MIEARLVCDGCGATFATAGHCWAKHWGRLRAAARRDGWARCRPRVRAPRGDYCQRCAPGKPVLAVIGPVRAGGGAA